MTRPSGNQENLNRVHLDGTDERSRGIPMVAIGDSNGLHHIHQIQVFGIGMP
jgi:hypothetical protein